MGVLTNLEPARVFYFFEEITKIPHGSGNVGQISDYLVNFEREKYFLYSGRFKECYHDKGSFGGL